MELVYQKGLWQEDSSAQWQKDSSAQFQAVSGSAPR